jgi:hypothetical protein
MEAIDYLTLTALFGMLATGIWGGIREHRQKKQGTYQSFKPEHYNDFDKRLENE